MRKPPWPQIATLLIKIYPFFSAHNKINAKEKSKYDVYYLLLLGIRKTHLHNFLHFIQIILWTFR